ncbi:hypothetical protein ABGB18_25280 [Nonomuraea sp. B12E4]|uniref:hypothetical protein n=1 Tax=Nonomuraea sp. B12E4 TaxID=3153564 RepID=UPI00325D0929
MCPPIQDRDRASRRFEQARPQGCQHTDSPEAARPRSAPSRWIYAHHIDWDARAA